MLSRPRGERDTDDRLPAPVGKHHENPLAAVVHHRRLAFCGTDIDDREQVIAGYNSWLSDVREQVEPGRLVEWRPGDGWGPICGALGIPVPDRPFPHENSTASYVGRKDERSRKDEARVAPLPAELSSDD